MDRLTENAGILPLGIYKRSATPFFEFSVSPWKLETTPAVSITPYVQQPTGQAVIIKRLRR